METTELYKGKVKLNFNPEKHHYTVDGRTIDGVTTILGTLNKPALVPWAVKMCAEYMEQNLPVGVPLDEITKKNLIAESKKIYSKKSGDAADHGTMLHDWIERWIKGQNPQPFVNDILRKSAEQFVEWVKKEDVKFTSSERKVYSLKYDYCGTADIFGTIGGVPFVGDVKTSSGIYDEMLLQVAAYNGAVEEEAGQPCQLGIIIRCGKDGAFEIAKWDREKLLGAHQAFLGLLACYRFMKTLKFNK